MCAQCASLMAPYFCAGTVIGFNALHVCIDWTFQVEVHDLASLAPLQTFDLSGSTCMTTCPVGGGRGDLTYVATANSVNLLKLIPIEFQVVIKKSNIVQLICVLTSCHYFVLAGYQLSTCRTDPVVLSPLQLYSSPSLAQLGVDLFLLSYLRRCRWKP